MYWHINALPLPACQPQLITLRVCRWPKLSWPPPLAGTFGLGVGWVGVGSCGWEGPSGAAVVCCWAQKWGWVAGDDALHLGEWGAGLSPPVPAVLSCVLWWIPGLYDQLPVCLLLVAFICCKPELTDRSHVEECWWSSRRGEHHTQ